MVAVDLHQHLWPEPFVELLRRRTRAPYLRDWRLVTEGEPAYDVQPADHEVGRRIEQDRQAGIGLACISLSAPLGIESLPREEAGALIDAWHEGALALPDHFAPWASVPTEEPDLVGLADLLSAPFAGVQLPATTLADPPGGTPRLRSFASPSSPASRCSCTRAPRRPRWACRRGGRRSSGTSRSCRPPGGPGTPSVGARSSRG